jgi:hypothetical protein
MAARILPIKIFYRGAPAMFFLASPRSGKGLGGWMSSQADRLNAAKKAEFAARSGTARRAAGRPCRAANDRPPG